MVKITFENGSLEISSLFCYSTASDAVKYASLNPGKIITATKSWQVNDCSGPSWSHSQKTQIHSCSVRIEGNFSEEERCKLFEDGWWKPEGFQFEQNCCYGGNSVITIE